MRVAWVALGALLLPGSAAAQLGQPQTPQPELGRTAPSAGANESFGPGAAAWSRRPMSEREYIDELARQYAGAQQLVGAALTDKDRSRIRSAISRDLIAWRTQYDPPRKDYGAMRERWLVNEDALSAVGWAKQRVDWLRAQQEWIVARHKG